MSFISLFILKAPLCLLCRVPLVPLAVHCYVFFIFLLSNNRILHIFSIHSHYIFAINKHKGKWVIVLINKKTPFAYHVEYRWLKMSYTLLLSDPNSASRNLQYIYLRLFRVTYWSSILQGQCHILDSFTNDTHFIKG